MGTSGIDCQLGVDGETGELRLLLGSRGELSGMLPAGGSVPKGVRVCTCVHLTFGCVCIYLCVFSQVATKSVGETEAGKLAH